MIYCTLVLVTLVFRTFYPLSPFYRFIRVRRQVSGGTLRNNEGTMPDVNSKVGGAGLRLDKYKLSVNNFKQNKTW